MKPLPLPFGVRIAISATTTLTVIILIAVAAANRRTSRPQAGSTVSWDQLMSSTDSDLVDDISGESFTNWIAANGSRTVELGLVNDGRVVWRYKQ